MNLLHDSKIRELWGAAIEQGFRFERNSKSYKFIPPDTTKPIVVVSCTPSNFEQEYYRMRERLRKSGCVC